MARREVLVTVCDQCGQSWQKPLKKAVKGEVLIPAGWLHLEATTSTRQVLSVDLCPKCKQVAMAAIGQGDRT